MIIPEQRPVLNPGKINVLICTTFVLGVLTLIGVAIAALLAVAALLNLMIDSFTEVTVKLSQLYTSGDSFVKLVMWLVVLILICKAAPYIARVVRASSYIPKAGGL